MQVRLSTPLTRMPWLLRRETSSTARSSVSRVSVRGQPTRLFALAFLANMLDLALSWPAVMRYGLGAEANPFPLMAWGWEHGLIGALAVKAALLAVIVSAAAMQPRYARPLLVLVGFAGMLGAISALAVL